MNFAIKNFVIMYKLCNCKIFADQLYNYEHCDYKLRNDQLCDEELRNDKLCICILCHDKLHFDKVVIKELRNHKHCKYKHCEYNYKLCNYKLCNNALCSKKTY